MENENQQFDWFNEDHLNELRLSLIEIILLGKTYCKNEVVLRKLRQIRPDAISDPGTPAPISPESPAE